jgi:MoaA/NifB/PqqE/SkfB family radical SAM enzyme/SAM-dependent methyltransferase
MHTGLDANRAYRNEILPVRSISALSANGGDLNNGVISMQMLNNIHAWKRLSWEGVSIYVFPEGPDWLVPSRSGDEVLRQLIRGGDPREFLARLAVSRNGDSAMGLLRTEQFLSLIPETSTRPYPGRDALLSLNGLRECWLHITDRCNLQCRHCLFSCSAGTRTTLPLEKISRVISEAYALGTRVFYLTGGEPLMHPDIEAVCRRVLTDHDDTQLVILSNGLLIPSRRALLDSLPADRLHFQISVDGIDEVHDRLRGRGSFARLSEAMALLPEMGAGASLAMAVHGGNVHQMTDIVDLAARWRAASVHYLWLLVTGNARPADFVLPDTLFAHLTAAQDEAARHGITIDNIRSLESQVFSAPGTRHDLGNAAWESLAVGPNGRVYPTPALVGQAAACGGHIDQGLERLWCHSPLFEDLRRRSLVNEPRYARNPLKYLVGGGDIDHSFYAGGDFTGHDPYVPLYNRMALWRIAEAARRGPQMPWPQVLLKMGDRLLQCHTAGDGVALTHSNCVLTLSATRRVVGDFYAEAASEPKTDIQNPVCYPQADVAHIPAEARVRSYGCGSPVMDADLQPGETVVDLGSGTGVECFIAARQVGAAGRVTGIDMLDDMLTRARSAAGSVSRRLGYENVSFRKGYLEGLPLEECSVDVVLSNCVINLSEDKRQTLAEIHRILKPGGRLVISDVVTDRPFPPAIANDPALRGECIAGAMVQDRLLSLLESVGFENIRIIKRFFYRRVQGHIFYSLTYAAFRPAPPVRRSVIYPGPYAGVVTDAGRLLLRGRRTELDWSEQIDEAGDILLLDDEGSVVNAASENTCACYTTPEKRDPAAGEGSSEIKIPSTDHFLVPPGKSMTGCMRCGSSLVYLERDRPERCVFCGEVQPANAVCERGHFVCDRCHSRDAVSVVQHLCLTSTETDMIDLLNRIRRHPAVPMHGPEHHFALPGVIVAAYRNSGGAAGQTEILSAIERGRGVPGGSCGFWGACGAALGVGIAFALLLQSNPVKADERQIVQHVTAQLLQTSSEVKAARCCQRETWMALQKAAELSELLLPLPLRAAGRTRCGQRGLNRECAGPDCPFYAPVEAQGGRGAKAQRDLL